MGIWGLTQLSILCRALKVKSTLTCQSINGSHLKTFTRGFSFLVCRSTMRSCSAVQRDSFRHHQVLLRLRYPDHHLVDKPLSLRTRKKRVAKLRGYLQWHELCCRLTSPRALISSVASVSLSLILKGETWDKSVRAKRAESFKAVVLAYRALSQ